MTLCEIGREKEAVQGQVRLKRGEEGEGRKVVLMAKREGR